MSSQTEQVSGRDATDRGRTQPLAGLSGRGITVSFGGVLALHDVTIEVPVGSVTGLIGPNGAGKSTLLAVLSGFRRPQAGTVEMNGTDISSLAPEARARRGIARTFQLPELFGELTVRDHLVLAHRAHHEPSRLVSDLYTGRAFLRPSRRETDDVTDILDLLGMRGLAERNVLSLPLGASRLVEVGRALASGPSVLLADEPSSGLDRRETALLGEALEAVVAERNIGVLLVEHDVDLVLRLSTRVCVLQFGQRIAEGAPAEVRADPRVQDAYLGTADEPADEAGSPSPEPRRSEIVVDRGSAVEREPLLSVRSLSVSYGPAQALQEVTVRVDAGSAVAILGSNGAGKSTLCRAISGLVPSSDGQITFADQDVTRESAHEISRLGLSHLPEGRGIFPGLSVQDNLRLAVQRLARSERRDARERVIEYFPVLGDRSRQLAGSLSGGEQQMLSLARALAVAPRLIIGDELSLGLAPLVIDAVFEGLARAKNEGISIIVIEQFIHRALALCDYAYILRRGTVCWEGPAQDAAAGAAEHYMGSTD